MRTGLAGEVTVTRERDAYSLARGIGDYYSLSFDLHQCMPLYLSRFQNHNRMYYIREDQICKAAKQRLESLLLGATLQQATRVIAQIPLCICMVGRAPSGITFVLTFIFAFSFKQKIYLSCGIPYIFIDSILVHATAGLL